MRWGELGLGRWLKNSEAAFGDIGLKFINIRQREELRRATYTTNAVEALHGIMRKATKTKGAFINEQALEKQLYLTLQYNKKSWQRKTRG